MTRIRTIIPKSEQTAPRIAANTGITLFLPDGTRYQGVYYKIDDDTFITTPTPTADTVVLTTTQTFKRAETIYDRIKGDTTSLYIAPSHYVPVITDEDVLIGYIERYFVMKRNEPGLFVEISNEQYNKYSFDNQQAINANLWNRFSMRWTIAGPLEEVITLNRKTVAVYENEDNLPGLSKFLFKLDEFYLGKR